MKTRTEVESTPFGFGTTMTTVRHIQSDGRETETYAVHSVVEFSLVTDVPVDKGSEQVFDWQ